MRSVRATGRCRGTASGAHARTAAAGGAMPPVARLRGGRTDRFVERSPLDLTNLVRLEDVAFLDVVEVLEVETALEAFLNLSHVVLEAPELVDDGVVDDRPLPHDAAARAAPDDAARDIAARDRADARRTEELSHLGLTGRRLL